MGNKESERREKGEGREKEGDGRSLPYQ